MNPGASVARAGRVPAIPANRPRPRPRRHPGHHAASAARKTVGLCLRRLRRLKMHERGGLRLGGGALRRVSNLALDARAFHLIARLFGAKFVPSTLEFLFLVRAVAFEIVAVGGERGGVPVNGVGGGVYHLQGGVALGRHLGADRGDGAADVLEEGGDDAVDVFHGGDEACAAGGGGGTGRLGRNGGRDGRRDGRGGGRRRDGRGGGRGPARGAERGARMRGARMGAPGPGVGYGDMTSGSAREQREGRSGARTESTPRARREARPRGSLWRAGRDRRRSNSRKRRV